MTAFALFLFIIGSMLHISFGYEEKMGKTISIRKCGINMWKFSSFFSRSKNQNKNSKKNRTFMDVVPSFCLDFFFSFVHVTIHNTPQILSFLLFRAATIWCCGCFSMNILSFSLLRICVGFCRFYSIFECRWRDNILGLLLPYLTCLAMHILNFMQITQWMNFFLFSNRILISFIRFRLKSKLFSNHEKHSEELVHKHILLMHEITRKINK